MPLHGKVVVLKRSGGDGTEFPLTSTCTFGRKPDCDIRIQIPQVSKEHCRIDLNENKEVILTNLSSVNPTQVNGQALQQPERLKHGDVITIIDRSFRFEYPPPPTPKKRASVGGKAEVTASDPHLKDGANTDNIQRSLEKPQEAESKEEASSLEGKTASPFSDLYQMIKQSLDVKTPRKSSISVLQTPSSKFCTPQVPSARKGNRQPVEEKGTPRQPAVEPQTSDVVLPATPKSTKKRCSTQLSTELTPQRFTVGEALEQISQPQRSPLRRRSKETTSPASEEKQVKSPAKKESSGPKSSEKGKKRKSGELGSDLPTQQMKRKRVSFGTQLSPELFDKRLPPDSPLRKGAAPRRSLSLYKPKQSLLRRASVIGLLKEHQSPKAKSPAKKKSPSPKKTSSAKSASPKAQSPKAKTPSPGKKSATPIKSSPKAKSPAQTPKSNVTPKKASPKATTPKKASPKATTTPKKASPKATTTPKKASPKATTTPKKASPKATTTPKKASPKATTTPKKASPKATTTPKKASPKATTTPKKASPKATTTPKKASPKAATTPKKASPKSATTPKKASPKSATTPKKASPKQTKAQTPKGPTKAQTPKPDSSTKPPRKSGTESLATPLAADQTPKVQGRFSVSRITTPSPVSEDSAMASCPSVMVTPKIPLSRKSMKSSTAKKTPALKSAARLMRRKSTMRTSMKVIASWADIVRFGKSKVQTAVPTKSQVAKKITKKKAIAKPQTPKRRLLDHVGTGHAASPATIVVGRAHRLVHPTGAPPKIVTNTAVLRKDLKMDEDLTGISDMFKTPKNDKRMSTKVVRSAKRTPLADIDKSQMEPSVLNTPEETGEMVVSPMSVASTMKGRRYNSEAVQRLLNDDIPPLDVQSESTEKAVPSTPTPQMTEGKTGKMTPKQKAEAVKELNPVKTPQQKSEQPECLSAVKRTMKTPQEKVEPVEDLGGKLLRTPRQRPVPQEECLTGVKRIMETPAAKSPPAEDLSGELLKTPPQNMEEPECLSAVKMSMKTPDQEVDHLECMSRSPRQKAKQQECLTGVKRIMKTPKEKSEPIDDIRGKLLLTPKQKVQQQQQECLTGVKRIMKTPRERVPPVEKNFGLKRLMQSPRLRGNAPVEDFEGLEELMREPVEEPIIGDADVNIEQPQVSEQVEAEKAMSTEEVANQQDDTEISAVVSVESSKTKPVCGRRATVIEHGVEEKDKEIEAPVKTRRGRKVESSASRPMPRGRNAKTPEESQEKAEEATVEQSMVISAQESFHNTVSAEPEQHSDPAIEEAEPSAALEEPVVKQKRARKTKAAVTVQPAEAHESNATPLDKLQNDLTAKPTRGRTTRAMDADEGALAEAAEAKDKEDSVVPIRGRRGKKTEAAAVPAVKQTRGRAGIGLKNIEVAKEVLPEEPEVTVTESKLEEFQTSEPEPTIKMVPEKTKRGRKKTAPIEPESEVNADEGELSVVKSKPAQTEQPLPTEKPTRGRRGKAQTVPLQPESAVASLPAVVETMDIQVEQPRRGRRTKITVEPSPSVAEVPTVEALPAPETPPEKPAQAEKPKRGRKARPAENSHTEQENVEALPSEPKRMRRTRKVEDQSETVQTTEEAPVVEPVKAEQLAPKSRKGAQKPKEAKSNTTGMTEEATLLSATEKPKGGRRGQETSAEMEEDAPETQSVRTKSTRRPVVPAAPAKRVGRVAKVTPKESTSPAVEEASPEASQVKPVKRGRSAAKANEHSLKSKRSIKWNSDIKVIEVTPLRTVRGRKANGTQQNKVNNVPTNPEEEDLSDKSQPAKRPRRGVKAAVVEETTAAEVQPKPRRGRLAKK